MIRAVLAVLKICACIDYHVCILCTDYACVCIYSALQERNGGGGLSKVATQNIHVEDEKQRPGETAPKGFLFKGTSSNGPFGLVVILDTWDDGRLKSTMAKNTQGFSGSVPNNRSSADHILEKELIFNTWCECA